VLQLWDSSAFEDKLSNESVKVAVQCLLAQEPALTSTLPDPVSKEEFLKIIVENGTVLHLKKRSESHDALYKRGVSTSNCTIILSGLFKVETGNDRIESECGPATAMATKALIGGPDGVEFVPDYTASLLSDTAKCLQINRISFQAILRMFEPSHPEKTRNTIDALLHRVGPKRMSSKRLVQSISVSANGSISSPTSTDVSRSTFDRKLFASSIRGRAYSDNASGGLVTVVSIDPDALN